MIAIPTKHIGIRLPEETINELERLGEFTAQSANQIAKQAILEWLEGQKLAAQDMISLPRPSFAMLLGLLDDDTKGRYAGQIAQKVIELYEYDAHKLAEFAQMDNFITAMVKFIGDRGFRWFDHITLQTDQAPYYFTGRHKMGRVWSEMFIMIFQHILDKISARFSLLAEKTVSNEFMVYLEFEPEQVGGPKKKKN